MIPSRECALNLTVCFNNEFSVLRLIFTVFVEVFFIVKPRVCLPEYGTAIRYNFVSMTVSLLSIFSHGRSGGELQSLPDASITGQ